MGIQVHPGAHGHGAHLLGPRELPNGREDLPSVRRYPTGRLCTQAVLHPRVSTSVFTESTTEAPSGWVSAVAVAPWTRSARRGDQFSTDDILARPLQSTSTECRLPPLCAEFCSEHDVWRLNVAHTFFMQVCVAGGRAGGHACAAYARLRVVIHTLGGIAAVRRGLARSQLVQRPL